MNADGSEFALDALRCREFSEPVFDAWLQRICGQCYCAVLVGVAGRLRRLLRVPLPSARRLAIMRVLVPLVEDLADDLPVELPQAHGKARAGTGTLVQRLTRLAFRNLKHTLESLDHAGAGLVGDHADGRIWLVARMFRSLGRQIELGAQRGVSWPPNTWQELHDLSAYSNNRLYANRAAPEAPVRADGAVEQPFDPQTAYKRLLLIGLCTVEDAGPLWLSIGADRFEAWVRASELRDATAFTGVIGACLVDQSGDQPPRRVPGALGEASGFRALVLPPDFLAALAAAKSGRGAPAA